MGTRLLHAGELARLAGVHKSTVLLAVRRGELRASRTVGRSARIAPEDARAYLAARGVIPPADLLPAAAPEVGVVTDTTDVVGLVLAALPAGARLVGGAHLYGALVDLGAARPRALVLDLDVAFLNPLRVLAAVRAVPHLRAVPVAAVGVSGEYAGAARVVGGAAFFPKVDTGGVARWLAAMLTVA